MKGKNMQYVIIEAFSEVSPLEAIGVLEIEVRDFLNKGWKPQGGVSVTFIPVDKVYYSGDDGFMAFQALTHDGEPD